MSSSCPYLSRLIVLSHSSMDLGPYHPFSNPNMLYDVSNYIHTKLLILLCLFGTTINQVRNIAYSCIFYLLSIYKCFMFVVAPWPLRTNPTNETKVCVQNNMFESLLYEHQ